MSRFLIANDVNHRQTIIRSMLDDYETYFFGTNYDVFKHYKVYFITINTNCILFKDINQSYMITEKKLKSKKLNFCMGFYTHEFYTKKGQHFHTHLLLFKLKSEKRMGKTTFINFFYDKKHMKNKSSIDFKNVTTILRLMNIIKYIMGTKTSQSKCELIKKDIILKKEFKMPLTVLYSFCPEKHLQLQRYLEGVMNPVSPVSSPKKKKMMKPIQAVLKKQMKPTQVLETIPETTNIFY